MPKASSNLCPLCVSFIIGKKKEFAGSKVWKLSEVADCSSFVLGHELLNRHGSMN
jgi:hypothetical protein